MAGINGKTIFHHRCEDKNECLESAENPCGPGGTCVNVEGSFECYCKVSFSH